MDIKKDFFLSEKRLSRVECELKFDLDSIGQYQSGHYPFCHYWLKVNEEWERERQGKNLKKLGSTIQHYHHHNHHHYCPSQTEPKNQLTNQTNDLTAVNSLNNLRVREREKIKITPYKHQYKGQIIKNMFLTRSRTWSMMIK